MPGFKKSKLLWGLTILKSMPYLEANLNGVCSLTTAFAEKHPLFTRFHTYVPTNARQRRDSVHALPAGHWTPLAGERERQLPLRCLSRAQGRIPSAPPIHNCSHRSCQVVQRIGPMQVVAVRARLLWGLVEDIALSTLNSHSVRFAHNSPLQVVSPPLSTKPRS